MQLGWKRAQVAGEQLRAVSRAQGCPPSSGLCPQLGAVGVPAHPRLHLTPFLRNHCTIIAKFGAKLWRHWHHPLNCSAFLSMPCSPLGSAADEPWLHPPRARALPTKCHRDSWLESIAGTKQPWEGPRAPSSMEKTSATELSRDAKPRADPGSLQHKCRRARGTRWPCDATRERPRAAQERRCVGGRGEGDFGAVISRGPCSSERFSSTASSEPGTPRASCPRPHTGSRPCAEPSRAVIPTRPTPGVENSSRSPDSRFPPSFRACSSARSRRCPCPPLCHPWLGTAGWQQLPPLIPSLTIIFLT